MRCPSSPASASLRAAPFVWALLAAACGGGNDPAVVSSAADAEAALERYCADCHNPAEFSGGFSVTDLDPAAVHQDARALGSRRPQAADAHDAAARRAAAASRPRTTRSRPGSRSTLDAPRRENPGAPALRRLNRAEYANAIRDLLDLDVDVRALLPPDDSAFGFDNIGDLLVVSPALLERYLVRRRPRQRAGRRRSDDGARRADLHRHAATSRKRSTSTGCRSAPSAASRCATRFPLDGEYEFDVALFRNNLDVIRGLEHPHQLEIAVDGERVFLGAVGGDARGGPRRHDGSPSGPTPPTRGSRSACRSRPARGS